eukprot:Cvel_13526.t1-p1 / transcript=Cvel_13526.t1 / gene=Cvel_13526 / organism=Chromera_velia_CCMP2878 / gene_product=hypothetical protein / transcript_product=hypothetical protein / location=Cvel_scaffold928:11953-13143(-) / protein_length=397 / sequence_SO=supercontig / SO=protein_coding / is_pseudo=false
MRTPLPPVDGTSRLYAKGGVIPLLQSSCANMASSSNGKIQNLPHQLASLERNAVDGTWLLVDIFDGRHGPYNRVLLTHDALVRAARRASVKQLLESALPYTQDVVGAMARAQTCSAFAVCVYAPPPISLNADALVVEGTPELRVASRTEPADGDGRGLRVPRAGKRQEGGRGEGEFIVAVATTEWSQRMRPTPSGRWDKERVGGGVIAALAGVIGCRAEDLRPVIPTFAWQGASCRTRVRDGPPCIYDARIGLGVCGNIFGGLGLGGAASSAEALFSSCVSMNGGEMTVLPGEGSWELAVPPPGAFDLCALDLECLGVGRAGQPDDGLDHTWPAAVSIARGKDVRAADSMAKYRSRNVLEADRRRAGGEVDGRREESGQRRRGGRGNYRGGYRGGKR